jgi:DNA polymerase III subunit epsilon
MNPSYFIPKTEEKFLDLKRPIVFFDLETTGTNTSKDRIVELFAIRLETDGTQHELYHLINPTTPISLGAMEVHGITDEMVVDKPTFAELGEELATFFQNADLGGYNIRRFDVPMLMEEFHRVKRYPINFNEVKLVDAMGIYHSKERRDLSAAVKFYLGREHEQAHSARADVQATIDILKHQLLKYDDLKPDTSFLHDYLNSGKNVDFGGKFARNDEGNIIFSFGKHKGKQACTQPEYLKWMFEEGDFPVDAKMVAKKIYMECKWEQEINEWLSANRIMQQVELASALYTTVKYEKDVFPFALKSQQGRQVLQYLNEPPSSLVFTHVEKARLLLSILDQLLRND